MTPEQIKSYKKQAEAWLVTQDLSIESCEINIEMYKKQILNLQKLCVAEQEERRLKVAAKAEVIQRLKALN
jgi:hypothetical protein